MRKRRRILAWFGLISVIAASVLLWLDVAMRPLVREYAVNRANTAASEAMAAAVEEVLCKAETYGETAVVRRDENGAVLSVQANTAAINRLSADVVTSVGKTLLKEEFSTLRLPVLNATGRTFLMGRGPKITIRLQQSGTATVRIGSRFSEAGINQTVHRLELTVTFRAVVMAAGLHEPIETTGTFLVTETVIVGTVPDRYVDISGK